MISTFEEALEYAKKNANANPIMARVVADYDRDLITISSMDVNDETRAQMIEDAKHMLLVTAQSAESNK